MLSQPAVELNLEFLSRVAVQPSRPSFTKGTIPLSIVDNSVANFSETGAVWFFSAPSPASNTLLNDTHPLSSEHLALSLAETLNPYSHLAGQLDFIANTTDQPTRFGRLGVTRPGPGVSFSTAKSPQPLLSLLPSKPHLSKTPIDTPPNTSLLNAAAFFPDDPLSLHDLKTTAPLPSTQITHTTHSCGGISLAIKIAHPLADAQALCTFARDWALTNRSLA